MTARFLLGIASLMLGAAGQTGAAPSAAGANTVTLYDGKAAGPTAPSIAAWGGGSGQDSTETFLFGGHSLKVTTLDAFQGARITFPTPVSLAGAGRVFQITLRRGGATLHYDPRTTSTTPPGDTSGPNTQFNPRGGFGQGGGGFGGGRRGRRGGRRGGAGAAPEAPLIPNITKLRLQFTFADGRQADILRAIPDTPDSTAGDAWYSVNVPVAALNGVGEAAQLKSVTLGGDQFGVFFVGRIRLGTLAAAPALTLDGPERVAPGQPLTLRVKGDMGLSTLKYEWDLGTEPNGLPLPTGAEAATRYFDSGQDHTVTVTITDLDGLSKPVTLTKTVHVN